LKITKIGSVIYVLTGEEMNSNATLITCEDRVMLVDGFAGSHDAAELQNFIQLELKKELKLIVCTHYFSDHMAAFPLFRPVPIIAHQYYEHTFTTEAYRNQEKKTRFVTPAITFSDEMTIHWGSNTLNLFYNPGHTLSTIAIDIPEADTIIMGDHSVGNIVYLYYSTPLMIKRALENIKSRNRSRIIAGHDGVSGIEKIENSLIYLDKLERSVKEAYSIGGINRIKEIKVEQCLANTAKVVDFDEIFHSKNLKAIIDRGLFFESL